MSSGLLPDWMIEQRREDCSLRGDTVAARRHFLWGDQLWLRCPPRSEIQGLHECLGAVVDPKNFDPRSFVEVEGDSCLIPPNSFVLAETIEYIEVPRDVLVICVGKSTLARCGLIVNVTPLEPEWRGRVTLEISNTTPLPAKVYANEGIAQMLFFRAAAPCKTSYADKKGKYQDQPGLTLPIVHGNVPKE